MKITYQFLIILFSGLIAGCETTVTSRQETPNGVDYSLVTTDGAEESDLLEKDISDSYLKTAKSDMATAIEKGVVWMVQDQVAGEEKVNLSQLLVHAREFQDAGHYQEAKRLAIKVSLLVQLALEQANSNENVAPYYSIAF